MPRVSHIRQMVRAHRRWHENFVLQRRDLLCIGTLGRIGAQPHPTFRSIRRIVVIPKMDNLVQRPDPGEELPHKLS